GEQPQADLPGGSLRVLRFLMVLRFLRLLRVVRIAREPAGLEDVLVGWEPPGLEDVSAPVRPGRRAGPAGAPGPPGGPVRGWLAPRWHRLCLCCRSRPGAGLRLTHPA